jgi:hypothetical protein
MIQVCRSFLNRTDDREGDFGSVRSLVDRARDFILHGGDQTAFLSECVEAGTVEGLHAVQMLYEDMYGGITYNYMLKAPAAFCLVRWEDQGLKALVEAAQRTPRSKNQSLTLEILATLASGEPLPQAKIWIGDEALVKRILELVRDKEQLYRTAGQLLRWYILSFEDDQDLLLALGMQLQQAATANPRLIDALFQAMAGRWLAVSSPTLQAYDELVRDHSDDEPSFQAFLEKHPLILDPMAFDVYPQPSIHGAKEPDFLIRRADDSFLVVEIETPAKPLITTTNKLSAEATYAVAQVTDYADFLTERLPSIRQYIPSFRRPDCLVVIGIERGLNKPQARALRVENESRHRVTIVGFDWLGRRAVSIRDSVVSGAVTITPRLRLA